MITLAGTGSPAFLSPTNSTSSSSVENMLISGGTETGAEGHMENLTWNKPNKGQPQVVYLVLPQFIQSVGSWEER